MSKRSAATKQSAVELVRGGKPVREVAKAYGVSDACVRLWVKNIQTRTTPPPVAALEMRKPNLARIREAISTLSEAGLI